MEHTQKQKLDHGIVDTQRLYYMTNMIAECTQSLNARRYELPIGESQWREQELRPTLVEVLFSPLPRPSPSTAKIQYHHHAGSYPDIESKMLP